MTRAKDVPYTLKQAEVYQQRAIDQACGRAWGYFKIHSDSMDSEQARKAFLEVANMATKEARKSIEFTQKAVHDKDAQITKLKKAIAALNKQLHNRGGDQRSDNARKSKHAKEIEALKNIAQDMV